MTENHDERLDEILADFLEKREAGEPITPEELIADHPDLAGEIREFLLDRQQIQGLARPLATAVVSRQPVLETIRYFGDYELIEEIARGGMGIVYKAKQTSLNRIVAVKMILSGRLASETDAKRFQTEAEAAANLKHPNIVSVHEVGRYDGQSYFSMDYVEGQNLSEITRENPLPARQASKYVRQIAEAIHFAHQQGTLHRDLKPSNILIDTNDDVHITDFGLAMRVEGNSGLTQTGQILGTPSYMPPEQAEGKRGLIGPASDIYALGAILYELLTGRPPFQTENAVETIRQVIEVDAPSVRLLNPAVPRDLETICLKCLQKQPHQRYLTAQQLAEDLTRFLDGAPILARPIGYPARFWRWCQRKPAISGMLAITALALTALITGLAVSNSLVTEALRDRTNAFEELEDQQELTQQVLNEKGRTLIDLQKQQDLTKEALGDKDQALQDKEAALASAKAAQARAENEAKRAAKAARSERETHQLSDRYLYMAHLNLVQQAWEHGDVNRMVDLLERHRPKDNEPDLRGFEWYYWWQKIHPRPATFALKNSGEAGQLCLSQDGHVVARLRGGEIFVSRLRENRWLESQLKPVVYPYRNQGRYQSITLAPDGKTLASGTWRGDLVLWDLITDQPFFVKQEHEAEILCMDFSTDGTRLATGDSHGTVILWNLTNRTPVKRWSDHRGAVYALQFSPDDQILATGGYDRVIQLRDVGSGEVQARFDAHTAMVFALAFSPDGRLLASGGSDREVLLQEVESRKVLAHLQGFDDSVTCLCFSPDGESLATGCLDRSIRLWETKTRHLTHLLKHHRGPVRSVKYRPDGKGLYSNADDGTSFWNLQPDDLSTIRWVGSGRHYLQFTPDGKRLIDLGEKLRLFDLEDGTEALVCQSTSRYRLSSVHMSGSPTLLLARSAIQNTRYGSRYDLLDLSLDPPVTECWTGGPVTWAAVTGDGLLATYLESEGKVSLRERTTNHVVGEFKIGSSRARTSRGSDVSELALSPDSCLLAVRYTNGKLSLLDAKTGKVKQELVGQNERSLIRYREPLFFTGDSQYLIECLGGRIKIWQVQDGALLADVKTSVRRLLSYHGSESHLLDHQVRNRIALSSRLHVLAIAESDGSIQLIDLAAKRNSMQLSGHTGPVTCIKFSPDGRTLISGGADRTIRFWDELTGELKTTLSGHKWPIVNLDISPDGQLLVSSGGGMRGPGSAAELRFWRGGLLEEQREPAVIRPEEYTPEIAGIPDLVQSLAKGGLAHETAVAALIKQVKPAVPALLTALEHDDPEIRRGAAQALGGMREEAAASPLGRRLSDDVKVVRQAALLALQKLNEAAVPVLADKLNHREASVRLLAIQGLASLGEQAGKIGPELTRLLNDADSNVQLAAAVAQLKMGIETSSAVKFLIQTAQNTSDREQKLQIIRLFGGLHTDHAVEQVLPLLLAGLEGEDAQRRLASLRSLLQLKSTSTRAVPVLLEYAQRKTIPNRELVIATLYWLDPFAAQRAGFQKPDASLKGLLDTAALDVGPKDWPQWGGSRFRNNTPEGVNIPTDWKVGEYGFKTRHYTGAKQNIKWSVPLGSQSYGNVVVANGKVFVGTNNGHGYLKRFPDEIDLGCLLCFEEQTGKFLWQYSSPKLATGRVHDWPLQGLCATPVVDGDRLWVTTNRCEVLCLDTQGFRDGENDGRYQRETSEALDEADVIWKFDMMGQLGVSPHNMTFCSPLIADGRLFICTANGLDEGHINLPSPNAPSFIAMDLETGEVLWTDNSPGMNILHGQWGSPSYGVFNGQPQIIFPGGDGWLYSFDPRGDEKGKSKLLWKFDCNPKESKWILGGRGTRNNLLAFPVIYDGLIYISVGQDPEHGEGVGHLWCIDPTKRGDVSPTLAVDKNGASIPHRRIQAVDPKAGERAIPNPNSAMVWHYDQLDRNHDGKIEFEEQFHRATGSVVIKDNLLYVADFSGLFHCVDAKTGIPHWTYDLFAACWGSPLIVDGKVYIADEDGEVAIFQHGTKQKLLNEVLMESSIYATPIVANNVLFISDRNTLFAISIATNFRSDSTLETP